MPILRSSIAPILFYCPFYGDSTNFIMLCNYILKVAGPLPSISENFYRFFQSTECSSTNFGPLAIKQSLLLDISQLVKLELLY